MSKEPSHDSKSNGASFNEALKFVLEKIEREEVALKQSKPSRSNKKSALSPLQKMVFQTLLTLIASVTTIFFATGLQFFKDHGVENTKQASQILDDGSTIRKEQKDRITLLESKVDEWREKYYTLLDKYTVLEATSKLTSIELEKLKSKVEELSKTHSTEVKGK